MSTSIWDRARAFDTEALLQLFHQHVGDLYRYAYGCLQDSTAAEAVTSVTFLSLAAEIEDFTGEGDARLFTWLLKRAHREVMRRGAPADARRPAMDALGPGERAMAQLPLEEREALVLRLVCDQSLDSVADIMGLEPLQAVLLSDIAQQHLLEATGGKLLQA